MSDHSRLVKVLAALLVSMTSGTVVLMALGSNPPSAGPFCLSSYYRLEPVKDAILSRTFQPPDRWKSIEIYYSGTKTGNIAELASYNGLADPQELNCHFVICNGNGGGDGQVQPTEKWQRQSSIPAGQTWFGNTQTIRVCVVAPDQVGGGQSTLPTDCQVKRTETLVEGLCRKFVIRPTSVYYPGDWR